MTAKSALVKAISTALGAAAEQPIPPAHRIAFESPDRLIDRHELEIRIGAGKTSICEKVADPRSGFPRPLKHGRDNRWLLREVNEYIARRVADRDQAVAE